MINTDKINRNYGFPEGDMTAEQMIGKIVSRTGVTREQAREALEKFNGDLLDAMIYVERTYGQAAQTAQAAQELLDEGTDPVVARTDGSARTERTTDTGSTARTEHTDSTDKRRRTEHGSC